MIEIPGYDAWKTAGPPEGPYPCDSCKEEFGEDDIDLHKDGQYCHDCTPCNLCGENVGEAQLDDAELCKVCAESREQDDYDRLHSSGGVA